MGAVGCERQGALVTAPRDHTGTTIHSSLALERPRVAGRGPQLPWKSNFTGRQPLYALSVGALAAAAHGAAQPAPRQRQHTMSSWWGRGSVRRQQHLRGPSIYVAGTAQQQHRQQRQDEQCSNCHQEGQQQQALSRS